MKLAHIRHTLVNALNDFRGAGANATHVLSTIEALIEEKIAPTTKNQDIPDLIAGALGVSRGTAYDMMREALAEQSHCDDCGGFDPECPLVKPAQQQELEHDEHGHECSPEEFLLRGILASELKCWHRLTADEAQNLVAFVQNMPAKPAQQQEPVAGKGKELSERLKLCARNVAFVAAGRVDMSSAAMQEMFALIDHVCVGLDSPQPAQQEPVVCGYDETTGICTNNPCCYTSPRPAQPQQEPVALLRVFMDSVDMGQSLAPNIEFKFASASAYPAAKMLPLGDYALYTSPQPRKPLTDHQTMSMTFNHHWLTSMTLRDAYRLGIRDAEAAHGIKENT